MFDDQTVADCDGFIPNISKLQVRRWELNDPKKASQP